MYPYVLIFGHSVFLYDILTNVGTVLGLLVMFIMMIKYGVKEKRIFASYAVSLALSYPFGRVLRGIMEADALSTLLSSGIHFMGVVFAFYFIFPLVYRLICKKAPTEEIKGFSALYFSIQHLFSRLGCYSLGCCFGVYYNGIFSITFPVGSNPYNVMGGELPTFPTQLFEALCAFCLIFISLFLIHKHKRAYSAFIILFCISIFISEFFMYKYPYERTISVLSMVQICCIVLALIEAFKIFRGRLKNEN